MFLRKPQEEVSYVALFSFLYTSRYIGSFEFPWLTRIQPCTVTSFVFHPAYFEDIWLNPFLQLVFITRLLPFAKYHY